LFALSAAFGPFGPFGPFGLPITRMPKYCNTSIILRSGNAVFFFESNRVLIGRLIEFPGVNACDKSMKNEYEKTGKARRDGQKGREMKEKKKEKKEKKRKGKEGKETKEGKTKQTPKEM